MCLGYCMLVFCSFVFFFFQAEDGIRDGTVTGVQTCALPICSSGLTAPAAVGLSTRSHVNSLVLIGMTEPQCHRSDIVLGKRSEERRVGKECRSRWSPDP